MELKKIHISDIGKIITGKTPRTSVAENYDGDIPFLTPSDDLSHKSAPRTTKTLTEKGLNEVRNCLLPPRSICVSCIGSDLGKVVMTIEPTVTNQQFNSIIPNKNFNADFVYYLMTLVGRELNYLSKTSTAVPIINKSSFSNYEVEVPDLETQEKIASILSSLDSKIELNRRINDNLEQQAQALFKSWFVDFEPFKDGEFVDSELGMIPKGWEIGTIEDLCQNIASGSTPSSMNQEYYNGQIKWFTTKELKDSFLIDSEKHISDEGHNNSSTKMFPRGTVLMAIYAAPTVGRLGILTSDATFNQAAVGLNPKQEIGSNYVFLLLKKERDSFNNLAIGAAQQNLSVKFVKTYPTIIPSKKVFVDFNVLVKPLFDRISLLSIEIETMTKTRDTLLPKLMSGELKIGRVEI